jgi:hypothetical protein
MKWTISWCGGGGEIKAVGKECIEGRKNEDQKGERKVEATRGQGPARLLPGLAGRRMKLQ